jgi:pimeloyl-ACP methyl ester carboxylesterase
MCRPPASCARRAIVGLTLPILLLPRAGRTSLAEDAPAPSPPGKLVDIGGYRLHIWCTGKGNPTVVLIPGSGDFSFTWGLVQPEVARFTRVCSYDGAGEAWSDPGPVPRTIKQKAYELHLLLHEAGVKGPYVLVGASGGGILARVFAREYRSEVVAMVLVDSTDPDTVVGRRINGKNVDVRVREDSKGRTVPPVQTMKSSPPGPPSAEGLERWESYLKGLGEPRILEPHNLLPADLQKLDTWARFHQPRARLEAAKRELAAAATPKTSNPNLGVDFEPEEFQELYEQAQREAHPLGDMPLIVLIAGDKSRTVGEQQKRADDPERRVFAEKRYQKIAQALLSRNGKYAVVESEHEIHLYQPAWVVEAIRQVVEAARKQTRLTPP